MVTRCHPLLLILHWDLVLIDLTIVAVVYALFAPPSLPPSLLASSPWPLVWFHVHDMSSIMQEEEALTELEAILNAIRDHLKGISKNDLIKLLGKEEEEEIRKRRSSSR